MRWINQLVVFPYQLVTRVTWRRRKLVQEADTISSFSSPASINWSPKTAEINPRRLLEMPLELVKLGEWVVEASCVL